MDASQKRARQFELTVEESDATTTLRLAGELDIATADAFTDKLEALTLSSGHKLVIDLTEVGFMDSTGLRNLIAANRRAGEGGYELVIVTGESPAKRVLELTRMDEHMTVVPKLA